jgi:hypothetical protein
VKISIIGLLSIVIFGGCSTYQARMIVPAPALREVFRGGTIKGLEDNDGQFLGTVGEYDMVEHVCSSKPIFDMNGRYVRTSVKCW